MKNLKYNLTILILTISCIVTAQETISLDEAISKAMENNFDIQLVSNNLIIAENNQSIQNSGYLPTVTANANANYSNSNVYIVTQDGFENNIDGIETTTYGASVACKLHHLQWW